MSTFMAKAGEVEQRWHLIDATDKVVGRLAVAIANILRGKHRPIYTPHADTGEFVIVVNVDKIKFTGKKWEQKTYSHYTHHPGGLRTHTAGEIFARYPERILEMAVKRMVPRNKLGRAQMSKLKIYAGPSHPHQAQQPQELKLDLQTLTESLIVAETASKKVYYLGTGRRKTAVARVRIAEGTGKIAINKRSLESFFTEDKDRGAVLGPLLLTEMRSRLDVFVKVHGGGYSGQAGAICQGLARALKDMFGQVPDEPAPAPLASADGDVEAAKPPESTESLFSKKLRDSGYLTRDGRMKERKKYGRKGARKSFQFSKR